MHTAETTEALIYEMGGWKLCRKQAQQGYGKNISTRTSMSTELFLGSALNPAAKVNLVIPNHGRPSDTCLIEIDGGRAAPGALANTQLPKHCTFFCRRPPPTYLPRRFSFL